MLPSGSDSSPLDSAPLADESRELLVWTGELQESVVEQDDGVLRAAGGCLRDPRRVRRLNLLQLSWDSSVCGDRLSLFPGAMGWPTSPQPLKLLPAADQQAWLG